ncbi:hypothetical protein FG379_000260 [Cryptosporidium bovis]|uniref:uncharacterized protein n=1 Tax=Cryptosporidium bovis TaxID=310047 RepID=UPI00351A32AB|nr:hypothetical protein FG379_000260 [Cryptosporidium bovis]
MSSNLLKIKCRRELGSLLSDFDIFDEGSGKTNISIWLFEWYILKGKKLPFENESKSDEIPFEELKFLYTILLNLPDDFPMIRYSQLWSKWLFPNLKLGFSHEKTEIWIKIIKLMEKRFPEVFVNDFDLYVGFLCDYLSSDCILKEKLLISMLCLLNKLLTIYIQPKKGFNIVINSLFDPLWTNYKLETEELEKLGRKIDLNTHKLKIRLIDEIYKIIQTVVSEIHIPFIELALSNNVSNLIKAESQRKHNLNYTNDLIQLLIGEKSKYSNFIPIIIKKMHDINYKKNKENDLKVIPNDGTNKVSSEYLLFYLFLHVNLKNNDKFESNIEYVNECFDFFIKKNTFNIRESTKIFDIDFNIKLKIYENIFEKLHDCILQKKTFSHIWKCYEYCILIDPVKSLNILSDVFLTFGVIKNKLNCSSLKKRKLAEYKCEKGINHMNGLEMMMLDLISINNEKGISGSQLSFSTELNGKEFLDYGDNILLKGEDYLFIKKNAIILSITNCFSAFLLTFTKLHDLPLFFSELSKIFLNQTLDLDICDMILLDQNILKVITNISNSILPGKAITIIESFFAFVKENKNKSLLHEHISTSWFGILLISIPICESSLNDFENTVEEIHEYVNKYDSNSGLLLNFRDNLLHITLNCGIINLIRKIISWNMNERKDLIEKMEYYYSKIENFKLTNEVYNTYLENSSVRLFYLKLVHFIFYLTRLRDSGVHKMDEILLIFDYYEELMSIISNFEFKFIIERILARFVSLNISNYKEIGNYLKSEYYYLEDSFGEKNNGFRLYLNSLLNIYVYNRIDCGNNRYYIPIESIVKVPYLFLLLFKEINTKLHFNNTDALCELTSKDSSKKRKIEPNKNIFNENNSKKTNLIEYFNDNQFNLLSNLLDFLNNKEIIMYLVNNKYLYQDTCDKLNSEVEINQNSCFTFGIIYRFYYNLLFKFKCENINDLSIVGKATFGILSWLKIEKEANVNDLIRMLMNNIFEINVKYFNNSIQKSELNKYLSLLIKLEYKDKNLFDKLITIFNETALYLINEMDENVISEKFFNGILNEMNDLDWFWWLRLNNKQVDNNEEIKNIQIINYMKDDLWIIKVQFLIELFKCFKEKDNVNKLEIKKLEKKIINKKNTIKSTVSGLIMLKQLKIDKNECEISLIYYIIKTCELYIAINNDIMEWDITLDNHEINKQVIEKNIEYENEMLDRIEKILIIIKEILTMSEQIFNNKTLVDTKNMNKGNLLLDFSITLIKSVILKAFNSLMCKCKENQELLNIIYFKLKKIYVDIFYVHYRIIRLNIKYGIFTVNNNKINEWVRYFIKCILEGSNMVNDYFKDTTCVYRHMKFYDNISELINNSPATGFLTEVFQEMNMNLDNTNINNDIFWEITSLIDFVWSIVKNKGYIYKSLSPCFKNSKNLYYEKWGVSDNLYFNLEILLLKLVDKFEIFLNESELMSKKDKIKVNYILFTFSLIKLSNIVSILYSCCVSCYISKSNKNDSNNNGKISLINNKITSLANLILTLSSKLSLFGINVISKGEWQFIFKELSDNDKELYCLSIFESLTISPYLPLYSLFNPLWDQSNKKKNNNNKGHIDVWISQFHLIQESLKHLISLGDNLISFHDEHILSYGIYSYIQHFKRISRLYPLIVTQITKNKVQRYSISIVCDLINYINTLNKRIQKYDSYLSNYSNSGNFTIGNKENNILNQDIRNAIDISIQIIKNSCLYHILGIIDDHCKQSLFVMLRDEQRIIFKQIIKKNDLKTCQKFG